MGRGTRYIIFIRIGYAPHVEGEVTLATVHFAPGDMQAGADLLGAESCQNLRLGESIGMGYLLVGVKCNAQPCGEQRNAGGSKKSFDVLHFFPLSPDRDNRRQARWRATYS